MYCLTMVYIRHIWQVFRTASEILYRYNVRLSFQSKILQKGYLEQSCSSLVMDKAEISKFSPTKNWFIWSWPWEICIRLHPCIVSVPRQQTKTSILRAWRQKTVLLQTLSKTGLITLLVFKKVQEQTVNITHILLFYSLVIRNILFSIKRQINVCLYIMILKLKCIYLLNTWLISFHAFLHIRVQRTQWIKHPFKIDFQRIQHLNQCSELNRGIVFSELAL